jgi:hypothetical protein
MYVLTVVNNYAFDITVDAQRTHILHPGQTVKLSEPLGNAYATIPGIGQMLFLDVGDKQIGGFSKATWGVYLAYQAEEVVFRYEGGGELTVTLDQFGRAELSGNGAFSSIRIGAFKLPGQQDLS